MTDTPPDKEHLPKSSAELIREARESLRGKAAGGPQASEDLMESARDWLGSTDPGAGYETAMEPVDDAVSSPSAARAEAEAESMFEPRPTATAPTRYRPQQAPMPPGPFGDGGRQARTVLVMVVLAGLVALGGVAVSLLAAGSGETDTVPFEVTVSSTGSITSASDPCSGAEISGDLEAVITYWNDAEAPRVTIDIIGPRLSGSDGATYALVLTGSSTGSPGQQEFAFESESMTMTRSDGVVIEDAATITIEIVDGRPDGWSYTSSGGACPG
jgi:hypothetical protein